MGPYAKMVITSYEKVIFFEAVYLFGYRLKRVLFGLF
jgi:hypothetical protein